MARITTSIPLIEFCCPKCKSALDEHFKDHDSAEADGYKCSSCGATYPIISGIPDFRVYADPYISIEADREKAMLLAEKGKSLSFKELVAYYYSITPEVPKDLAKHYLNHHVAGAARGTGIMRRISSYRLGKIDSWEVILDLGCGTGGFLSAAGPVANAIGVDIAFRWLVIAQKRLEELGITDIPLICACADFLPFANNSFDLIVAENLIEHVRDQGGLFAEIGRVRRHSGRFYARTVNRYALGPEPHVGVWGVGYLPRNMMNTYVKLVKRMPYEHIHLQSYEDLRQSIERSRQFDLTVVPPMLDAHDYQHHPAPKRMLFQAYDRLSRMRQLKELLRKIGPYLDIVSPPKKLTKSRTRELSALARV